MADLAFLFHWPLSELDALRPAELADWWRRALDRVEALRGRARP